MNDTKLKVQTIDAKNKILGKVAAEAAVILRGKNKPEFVPNKVCGEKVLIINASEISVTGRKMQQKEYYRHSGYLGNLKTTKMKDIFKKDPSQIIHRAIFGMLPRNKLRKEYLKNLEIRNEE